MTEEINLSILQDQSGRAIEDIISLVERLNLSTDVGDLKHRVEKTVLSIERKIQNLRDRATDRSKLVLEGAKQSLFSVATVLKLGHSVQNLENVERYLLELDHFLHHAGQMQEGMIEYSFLEFQIKHLPGLIREVKLRSRVDFEERVQAELDARVAKASVNDPEKAMTSKFIKFPTLPKAPAHWSMTMTINNGDDVKSLANLSFFLAALKQIKGVEITIEQLKKGSVFTKIKVWFKSDEAKKQAEELLEDSRKFAKGKLTKEYEETEKTKKETEVIELEKERLKRELEEADSAYTTKKKEIELTMLEVQLERAKMENEQLSIDLFQKKMKLLTEMVAENLITNEEAKLIINGKMYFEKKGNELFLGPNIKDIPPAA